MSNFHNKFHCFSQIVSGNKEAFDEFFKQYYPKLIQFARQYVPSLQQAEDVVGEVLTKILIHRERVFGYEHFEAYLYSSVKNQALSSLKKNKKTDPYSLDLENLKPSGADPYEILVEQEMLENLNNIIHHLPPKRKMVFQLIREEGFSYRQVAELMEISERTVEVHLKLAVKSLREGMEVYQNLKKKHKYLSYVVGNLAFLWFFPVISKIIF